MNWWIAHRSRNVILGASSRLQRRPVLIDIDKRRRERRKKREGREMTRTAEISTPYCLMFEKELRPISKGGSTREILLSWNRIVSPVFRDPNRLRSQLRSPRVCFTKRIGS